MKMSEVVKGSDTETCIDYDGTGFVDCGFSILFTGCTLIALKNCAEVVSLRSFFYLSIISASFV